MPPKAKITKQMIIDAAFEIIRELGVESVNARTLAKRLECSTQPVMYHFSSVEEIKREAYKKADEYHSRCLMDIRECEYEPMVQIGLSYVRFAATEKNLFKFLFQSDHFSTQTLDGLADSEEIRPLIEMTAQMQGIDFERAKLLFVTRFLTMHGIASMLANNSMVYDEPYILSLVQNT